MEVIVHQAPLSMGFSRREYWSKLPFPPPEDLPNPGIEPSSLMSPVLAGRFFITSTTWEAPSWNRLHSKTRRAIATATAKSLQSCLALCDPIDGSPPGSAVPGILQARTLEWAAISFSNAWEWRVKSECEVAQSCLTLSDLMDCSPPGSSVRGIFQARGLEWGAPAF